MKEELQERSRWFQISTKGKGKEHKNKEDEVWQSGDCQNSSKQNSMSDESKRLPIFEFKARLCMEGQNWNLEGWMFANNYETWQDWSHGSWVQEGSEITFMKNLLDGPKFCDLLEMERLIYSTSKMDKYTFLFQEDGVAANFQISGKQRMAPTPSGIYLKAPAWTSIEYI